MIRFYWPHVFINTAYEGHDRMLHRANLLKKAPKGDLIHEIRPNATFLVLVD